MRRALLVVPLALVALAAPASAEPRSSTRDGKTLTVSQGSGLAVDGQPVRVTGSGYDRSKGIYVAFCVDNGPGRVPTPCGGGADTEGDSGGSVWISDLPPAYGSGLARPYGDGGTFDVTITVRAQLDEETDCRVVRCAVVTRNDHTRSDDRSQDVVVPVSFAIQGPTATAAPSRTAPASPADRAPGTTEAAGRPRPAAPEAPASSLPSAEASAASAATGTAAPDDEVSASDSTVAPSTGASSAVPGSGPSAWAVVLPALLVSGLGAAVVRVVRRRSAGA